MSLTRKLSAALYDRVMQRPEEAGLTDWRRELLTHACGRVLEIGPGTGVNLPLYPDTAEDLVALEPNSAMAERMALRGYSGSGALSIVHGYAHALPFEDQSFDTVVATLVLCSVRNPVDTLLELKRVLKPSGKLLFLEHVAAPEAGLRRWQDRVDPLWNSFTGDCHLNRRTEEHLAEAGFHIEELERGQMPRAPALLNPTIRGIARPQVSDSSA
jgi:ubiquinone/menaquinone biosynthesis C-methylase UbiE